MTSPAPTYEAAVNEVILGKQPSRRRRWTAAAKKADALLAANRKKYQA